ncbi:hypothetical protein B0H17DRAFT_1143592 [Mycena rosella]|uniref:Uncharacterized protein n=1 Tax=Mycena rosella TaxID=1033263 RepID=A0AAD7CUL1_MYCRO|nr:hypothetical protein B0H17DRAFT_1143592 [Mycena rosella]
MDAKDFPFWTAWSHEAGNDGLRIRIESDYCWTAQLSHYIKAGARRREVDCVLGRAKGIRRKKKMAVIDSGSGPGRLKKEILSIHQKFRGWQNKRARLKVFGRAVNCKNNIGLVLKYIAAAVWSLVESQHRVQDVRQRSGASEAKRHAVDR